MIMNVNANGMEQLTRRRDDAERLVALAEYLNQEEGDLIRSVYSRGLRASEIARAAGCRPRDVQRRLRRAMNRVRDPRFLFTIAHRDTWPRRRRRVASLVILQGISQRHAARRLSISLHRVRTEIEAVRALLDTVAGAAAGARSIDY